MPKRKSFAKQIQELKPEPGKRLTLAVPGADNLFVRATQTAKSFTVIARQKRTGKQVWATIPTDGIDTDNITEGELDAVRTLAREAIANIKQGKDPFPAPPAGPESLDKIGANFMRRYVRGRGLATAGEIERQLKVYVYPRLGDMPINDIRRSDIANLLDEIEDENGPTQADRVLATLRKLFNWHCTRDDDFISPVVKGMARTIPSERRRERVMSDEEIRAMWPILGKMGAYGALLKILLLTGQRLDKVRSMKWGDIEGGIWTIPQVHKREKANGGKLPLPPVALEVIEGLPSISGNPFVFASGRTDHHINSFPKDKARLDKRLSDALGVDVTPWVLHSLRHTAKTLMARAGVSEFDSERLLGHVIPGVAATYNHYSFTEEKGAALERLAAEIGRILDPPDENVVQIEAAR